MHLRASWKIWRQRYLLFHHKPRQDAHPDPAHLLHDPRRIQPAIIVLPARHRHGVVEQNFVRHGRASGDRRANGLNARVVIGPIANILKHMCAGGKQRLANPIGPLSAHLCEPQSLADPSIAPCSDSQCRNRRGCLREFWLSCCAGTQSRNMARDWPKWARYSAVCAASIRSKAPVRRAEPQPSAINMWPNFCCNHHRIERVAIGKEHCALRILRPKHPAVPF